MKGRDFLLEGLDGSNPLGFLAAIGTLRSLTYALPGDRVTMRWSASGGAWRPCVVVNGVSDEDDLITRLAGWLAEVPAGASFGFADDLTVSGEAFRDHAFATVELASSPRPGTDRRPAEFAAAFACDGVVTDAGLVNDTALRTMSGAGHQHFLAFMRTIMSETTVEHLRRALLYPWVYDDPVASRSLRWDPQEDSRYALQWKNPSGDPARNRGGSVLGANRMAIEGLPLMPCAPVGRTLRTVGFVGRGARDTYWTWPIWEPAITLDVCRSLLAHPLLVSSEPSGSRALRATGVVTAFRSQRITVGKYRNLTPASAVY